MLEQLRTKGYLQPEAYHTQARDIKNALQKNKDERIKLMESTYGKTIETIRKVRHQLEELKEPLDNFDENLFGNMVRSVQINKSNQVIFTLLCGLKFTERM